MRIALRELKSFSQCPALYYFEQQFGMSNLSSLEVEAIRKIVSMCYTRVLETDFKASWRTIVSWADKILFQDVNIADSHLLEKRLLTIEYCLNFLRVWYNTIYLVEDVFGYSNLNLEKEIEDVQVLTTLPFVTMDKQDVRLVLIDDKVLSQRALSNDIIPRGNAYILSEALDREKIKILYLRIGDRGGFTRLDSETGPDDHKRMEHSLRQMIKALKRNLRYPSITSSCNTCKFKRRCKL